LDLIQQAARPDRRVEGSLNVAARLRGAMVASIKYSPLSRWEIAAQMSELTGTEVSKYMLDAWTSESKDGHRAPAEYLPAFAVATRSADAFKVLAEPAGLFVVQGPEALRAEIQKIDENIRQAQAEKRELAALLKRLDGGHARA
jgi:hypothetical protein